MSLAFHITDATIHMLGQIGAYALLFALLCLLGACLARLCKSFYNEGYDDGVQAARAVPKTATKEEAGKK